MAKYDMNRDRLLLPSGSWARRDMGGQRGFVFNIN